MSIKWYRGAAEKSKRVMTPKRDNPKAPKSVKPKRLKKLWRPKGPGVYRPRVRVPFVTAGLGAGRHNTSIAGLNAIQQIERENGMTITRIEWVRNRSASKKHSCKSSSEEGGAGSKGGICSELENQKWPAGGPGPTAMAEFKQTIRNGYGRSKGWGIWGASHINCHCAVRITMEGLKDNVHKGKKATFLVSSDADPFEPPKSDIAGAPQSQMMVTNSTAGYAIDPTPDSTTTDKGQLVEPDEHMLNLLKKTWSGDKQQILANVVLLDDFGKDAGYVDYIKPKTIAPATGISPEEAVAGEVEYVDETPEDESGAGGESGPPSEAATAEDKSKKALEYLERLRLKEQEEADAAKRAESAKPEVPPAAEPDVKGPMQ